ncbi:MAG: hypothetical protein C5B60_10510 [Chloroflexi bacterium]|nr:MAG: hypothetical protein C5B60_10510 [Chloroflexota bacterium]
MTEAEASRPLAAATPGDSAGYIWTIRLAAGMFTLLQVLITSSAAASASPAMLTMQRSLVDYSEQGGVSIDQLGDPLFGLFLVTYAGALLCLIITLGFAWYAGRVVRENSGGTAGAARAGMSVALTTGLVWLFIGIPLIVVTHADGTIAWLVATTGVILATPSGPPTTSVFMTSPGLPYLLIELVALLLQLALFLTFVLPASAIAGRMGAGSVHATAVHNAG